MLSFGLVRTFGWQPGWTVSPATTSPVARDLMRALQGLARARFPHFSYLWLHISRAQTPRCKFRLPSESFVVSLPAGRSYHMTAGEVAQAELCELEMTVSFAVPIEQRELATLRDHDRAVLENAGFVANLTTS